MPMEKSVEELWNEVEGHPKRQVTAIVIGMGNVRNIHNVVIQKPGKM